MVKSPRHSYLRQQMKDVLETPLFTFTFKIMSNRYMAYLLAVSFGHENICSWVKNKMNHIKKKMHQNGTFLHDGVCGKFDKKYRRLILLMFLMVCVSLCMLQCTRMGHLGLQMLKCNKQNSGLPFSGLK